jgi:hypothetical protein
VKLIRERDLGRAELYLEWVVFRKSEKPEIHKSEVFTKVRSGDELQLSLELVPFSDTSNQYSYAVFVREQDSPERFLSIGGALVQHPVVVSLLGRTGVLAQRFAKSVAPIARSQVANLGMDDTLLQFTGFVDGLTPMGSFTLQGPRKGPSANLTLEHFED